MLAKEFPFSKLNGKKVNVLIFPNLESANITIKLLKQIDGSESIGPIILGFKKPAHIIQLGASVDEMVNMAAVAVVDAQAKTTKEIKFLTFKKIKKNMITQIRGRLVEKNPTYC